MVNKPTALILYSLPGEVAGTMTSYIRALETLPGFDTRALNVSWQLPGSLDLDRFDTLLIHYSLMANEDAIQGPISLSPTSVARIGASKAIKGVFMQDEHRNVAVAIRALRTLGTNVFFTCMPADVMRIVYPTEELPKVTLVNVLTGYVDDALLHGKDLAAYSRRPIDVGYRARKVPFWLGTLAQEKWSIAERFKKDATPFHITCDISTREEDRLYGNAWPQFLTRCKAVLGTESGASVIDKDGSLRTAVDAALALDIHTSFQDVYERFLKDVDGKITNAQISPRCFEAAASKTLMILYEGGYSGRLQSWRHYVPLKKDHSNLTEVVDVLRDEARANEIIENAYRECALAPQNSYVAFQKIVSEAILAARPSSDRQNAYADSEWKVVTTENNSLASRVDRFRSLNRRFLALTSAIIPTQSARRTSAALSRAAKAILFRDR